ncbi:hypothetical protein [Phenylobacterium sp.]|jgi:hypothetical protein|uniref:hypothetical protein n=1 Tax=Phenylobacterium sp. TaxID=1871053 RepID=UPI002F3FDC3D
MTSNPEMAERHGRVLAELAELGLTFARRLAARAEAAEGEEAAQALALAFHRVSRSVRLTLALESRLAAERRQGMREDRVLTERAVERRKDQVRAVVARAFCDERESDEAERLLDELEERLDEDALFEQFLAGPVEACISRIRAGLGLPPADPANDAELFAGAATGPPAARDPFTAHPGWPAQDPLTRLSPGRAQADQSDFNPL